MRILKVTDEVISQQPSTLDQSVPATQNNKYDEQLMVLDVRVHSLKKEMLYNKEDRAFKNMFYSIIIRVFLLKDDSVRLGDCSATDVINEQK